MEWITRHHSRGAGDSFALISHEHDNEEVAALAERHYLRIQEVLAIEREEEMRRDKATELRVSNKLIWRQ